MIVSTFDQTKAEQFGQKMVNVLNHAALALMTSLGHRTGLFDALAQLPASTSQQIAEASGLNERYVREWLGAMVTAGVVEYDPAGRTFLLPAEHAACLTRSASPNNLAASTQWFAVLGHAEDQVVEAFKHGRGLPYSAYHRFHEVMAEESAQTVVAALHDHILPLVPDLFERLEAGLRVLDVGCGRGQALLWLAGKFPRSRFLGCDLSPEAIAEASEDARRMHLDNVAFEVRDAAELGHEGQFDLILAFDAIHDQAKPDRVLYNVAQALKPDGTFLMQDIAGSSHLHQDVEHPLGTFLYTVSCMHCMSVSLGQGGPGLGAMWGKETALRMLREAGFRELRCEQLPHDPINFYYIARR